MTSPWNPARARPMVALLMLGILASACGSTATTETRPTGTTAAPGSVVSLEVEVLGSVAHDPRAFTQGLEFDGDRLYESTGHYDASTVREIDPATGEVLRSAAVDGELFAEGISFVDGELIQLTWKAGRALVYDAETFELRRELTYDTQGWGLCDRPTELAMSDGSATITFRDPTSFAVIRTVEVTRDGIPVIDLNELECVNDAIWANVWQTDEILRIDPTSGAVTAVVDAAGLLTPEQAAAADVLNGIAYNEQTETFWITGKYWPTMFEVRFVPVGP